jgi:hypothetical protein
VEAKTGKNADSQPDLLIVDLTKPASKKAAK